MSGGRNEATPVYLAGGWRISRTLALDVATGLVTVATPGLATRKPS